jgi:hypothetical protein
LLCPATGHTFGYEGDEPSVALGEALRATTEWFGRHLHPESS